jgi:hypothetical protein
LRPSERIAPLFARLGSLGESELAYAASLTGCLHDPIQIGSCRTTREGRWYSRIAGLFARTSVLATSPAIREARFARRAPLCERTYKNPSAYYAKASLTGKRPPHGDPPTGGERTYGFRLPHGLTREGGEIRPNSERVPRQGRGTRPPSDFCRFALLPPSRAPYGGGERTYKNTSAYYAKASLPEGGVSDPLTGTPRRGPVRGAGDP